MRFTCAKTIMAYLLIAVHGIKLARLYKIQLNGFTIYIGRHKSVKCLKRSSSV